MIKKFLNYLASHPVWLLIVCTSLYTLYVANNKLANEDYGAGIDGLMLAPWVSLIAVTFNVVFYAVTGLFDWQYIREEWKKIIPGGIVTGNIVFSGVLTLALKIIKLTEGATIQKALGIPMSLLAVLIFLKNERKALRQDYYQWMGGALAIGAIYLSIRDVTGGKILELPPFVLVLLLVYALSTFIRVPYLRTAKNKLKYGAGEQIFATITVCIFCVLVAFGDMNVLPGKLIAPFTKIQTGLLHPTWNLILWAFIIALPFALYAPISVLLLMYNQAGSTAMLGYIMQKLAGVGGATFGLPLLHLFVWIFFTRQESSRVPWYDIKEILALFLFSAATFIALIPQLRVYLRVKEEEKRKKTPLSAVIRTSASPA